MISAITKIIERIAVSNIFFRYLCLMYYGNVVEKEVDIADISNKDNILCIGGGPFPFTAIEIVKQTGARVTVVDKDKDAIFCAKGVVNALGMDGSIDIRMNEGETVNVKGYSHIHIAFQVHPKELVLTNVCNQIAPGTKILVRHTKKIFNHIFYGIRTDVCNKEAGFISETLSCADCTLKNTVLLVKNDMSTKYEKCNSICGRDSSPDRNIVDL